MGLFGKHRLAADAGKRWDIEPLSMEKDDYNTVLDWLRGLSQADYETVCAVAKIYREADDAAATQLGVVNGPVTFIDPPTPLLDEPLDFLDDEPKKIADIVKIKPQ